MEGKWGQLGQLLREEDCRQGENLHCEGDLQLEQLGLAVQEQGQLEQRGWEGDRDQL